MPKSQLKGVSYICARKSTQTSQRQTQHVEISLVYSFHHISLVSNLHILVVPGACGLPEYYDKVINGIRAKGHSIHAIHLPSSGKSTGKGRDGPLPTMYDDAAYIAAELTKLADDGCDIILCWDSYGGTPSTQSIKGLTKTDRMKDGKAGGVVHLAYMTCLVPKVGESAGAVLAGAAEENKIAFEPDENGWLRHVNPAASARVVFSSLSNEDGEAWIRHFPLQSSAVFGNEPTYAGYKDVPVSYLVAEDDLCIPATTQRKEIGMIESESVRKVDVTSVRADHVPNETATEEVVSWLLDVVQNAQHE